MAMKTRFAITFALLLASGTVLGVCYQEGDSVIVTGVIKSVKLDMANGSDASVPVLQLNKPICIIEEHFGEGPDIPANVTQLQLLGRNPVYNVPVELKGKIQTGGNTQYYAVPNSLKVTAGRKLAR